MPDIITPTSEFTMEQAAIFIDDGMLVIDENHVPIMRHHTEIVGKIFNDRIVVVASQVNYTVNNVLRVVVDPEKVHESYITTQKRRKYWLFGEFVEKRVVEDGWVRLQRVTPVSFESSNWTIIRKK